MVGFYSIGLATDSWSSPGEAQLILTLYYKVVVVKGLLAQLLLALPIWWGLRRLGLWGAASQGRLRLGLELLAAATVAYCVVAPLLLSVEFEHWPALSMPSWSNRIVNLLMMSPAVAFAAWLPRTLLLPTHPLPLDPTAQSGANS
jgi:hypothetical protein